MVGSRDDLGAEGARHSSRPVLFRRGGRAGRGFAAIVPTNGRTHACNRSTESADSAAILPALRNLARREDIWLLGGVIYHLALSDVLANFRPEEDDALLASLLLLDKSLSQQGLNHYAAALVAARA